MAKVLSSDITDGQRFRDSLAAGTRGNSRLEVECVPAGQSCGERWVMMTSRTSSLKLSQVSIQRVVVNHEKHTSGLSSVAVSTCRRPARRSQCSAAHCAQSTRSACSCSRRPRSPSRTASHQLRAPPCTAAGPTYSLHVVQVDDNPVALAVGDFLQLVHVLDLGLAAAGSCCIRRSVVRVVDHVVLFFGVAIKVEVAQLVGGFGGRGFEVFEEVDEGSYAPLAGTHVAVVYTNPPAPHS
jgi:hypothetical protein